MNTYTFHVREEFAESEAIVAELREKIRRQCNLLYAVMRQQIRENVEGFEPGCMIHDKPFDENWQLDPVLPRISGLMTPDEFKIMNSLPAAMRPAWPPSFFRGTSKSRAFTCRFSAEMRKTS